MNKCLFIGIDSGFSGGIATIDVAGNVAAIKCPKTADDMNDTLYELTYNWNPLNIYIYIENVGTMSSNNSSLSFKFGYNYGIWKGILSSMQINLSEVTPFVWQKHYGIPKQHKNKQELTKKERKRWLKKKADTLFPQINVTFNVSDALLIANYCKHVEGGNK